MPKDFSIIWLSNILTMSVLYEGHSRIHIVLGQVHIALGQVHIALGQVHIALGQVHIALGQVHIVWIFISTYIVVFLCSTILMK
jgi:hypothetical protein